MANGPLDEALILIKQGETLMFQELFEKSKGQPIKYKDKTIQMIDNFPIKEEKGYLQIKIVSTNSKRKQGIGLRMKNKNYFIYKNEVINKPISFWEDNSKIEKFFVKTKEKEIVVYNLWDNGDGVVQFWHNGAALYFEEIENGRRYYCNDGEPDDDFDDLIFELTIIE